MFLRVRTVALNAYRESVRARILLGLSGVAFFVSAFSLVIGSFTLTSAARVVSDIGTASISLFSVAVAIVIGATSLHRELEQKTIFPILARPIGRGEYIIGKYLGVLLTIIVFVAADCGLVLSLTSVLAGRSALLVLGVSLGLFALLLLAAWRSVWARTYGIIVWAFSFLIAGTLLAAVDPLEQRMVLTSGFLTVLEVSVVTGFATLLASFSSPFLSSLLTIGIWIIGRSADSFDRFPKRYFGEAIASAAKLLGRAWPNLQLFVPPRPLLTGESADVDRTAYLLGCVGTSVGWTAAFLALAIVVFKRRDFL